MDKRNKISFIPQKPISRKIKGPVRPASLMIAVSFAVFFFTFIVYGGMFFYNLNLEKVVEGKQEELKLAKEKLDPGDIMGRAQRLQEKVSNVSGILDSHIAPSVVFGLIEDITLQSISFNTFEFTEGNNASEQGMEKSDGASFSINLKGVAPSYSSVAYQSNVIEKEIKKSNRVENFIISNISLDNTGSILFDLELSISPSLLVYRDSIKQDQIFKKEIENIEQINNEDTPSLDSFGLEELDVIFNESE